MKRLLAYFKENEGKSYKGLETDEPVSTLRSRILTEGFVLQLDRDGLEFQNPVTKDVVLIC